ncbi:MAG: thiamine-phosphate kinase [Litorimonas sp.]
MDELDFIALLRPLSGPGSFDLSDDAARLDVPDGHDLVVSQDTMVEGVHFPAGRIGGGFSERLLRVALSDLAAKGARPVTYMLSVAWPRGRDARWIKGFVTGLSDAQSSFDLYLLGGDTTSTEGPLVATATVFGVVPSETLVKRSGAMPGDDIWYTGTLGFAGKGLEVVNGRIGALAPTDAIKAEAAYLRPEPRFSLRKMIRSHATACADISDGLLVEAGHISKASSVALDLNSPLPEGSDFGDDYELLLTASTDDRERIKEFARRAGVRITLCGRVRCGSGVSLDGRPVERAAGYRHRF